MESLAGQLVQSGIIIFQNGRPDDTLLFGRESAGVTAEVAAHAHETVRIPLVDGMRSLNVAVAAAMILGEALRQTGAFGESQT